MAEPIDFASLGYEEEKPAATGLPTFLPEDREAAVKAFVENKATPAQLYANTMEVLAKRHKTQDIKEAYDREPGKDGDWSPVSITIPSSRHPGLEDTIDIRSELAAIDREAFKRLRSSAEAGGEPEAPIPGQATVRRGLAGLKATPEGKLGYVQSLFPSARIDPDANEEGNLTGNFIIREPGKPPKIWDSEKFTLADLQDYSGDVLEGAIGGAGSVIGTALGGAPGGVGGGFAADLAASGARQGLSSALPGSDELTAGDRLAMAGTNAAAGLVGEGVGRVLAPVVKGGARLTSQGAKRAWGAMPEKVGGVIPTGAATAKRSAAESAARYEVSKELGSISDQELGKQLNAEYMREGDELERAVSGATGEKFGLSLGQKSGNKWALGIERTIAQTPETMDPVAREQQKRLLTTAKFADSIVDSVASDPAKLGRADVGQQTADAINRHIKGLIDARSAEAGPLYDAAKAATGGARVIPTDATREAMRELSEQVKFAPAKIGGQIKAVLGKIEQAASKGGRLTIEDVQNMRSLWGQAARGDVTIIDGMSQSNSRRIARGILDAIDRDLDTAAGSINAGKGVEALRAANAAWRKHTEQISEVADSTINRLLKLDDASNTEAIVSRVRSMSQAQRKNLMGIVDKTSPEAAANLRAQVLRDVFEQGGKPQAATEFGRELQAAGKGTSIKPNTLRGAIVDNADLLGDLFGGDAKSRLKITQLVKVLDRLGDGPGIVGSDTYYKVVQSGIAAAVAGGPRGLVDAASSAARTMIEKRLMSPETLAKVVSTPEGVADLTKVMQTAVDAAIDKRKPGLDAVKEAIAALTRMGIYASGDVVEQKPRFKIRPQDRKP